MPVMTVSTGESARVPSTFAANSRSDGLCCGTELHFESRPVPIGQLNDGIHFAARRVAGVVDLSPERLRQDTKVMHHLGLEELSREAEVSTQGGGVSTEESNRDGRIAEVPLRLLSKSRGRSEMSGPRRLIFDDEDPAQRIHVFADRIARQRRLITRESGDRRFCSRGSCQRLHEPANPQGISGAPGGINVDVDHGIDIVAVARQGVLDRQADRSRPSTDGHTGQKTVEVERCRTLPRGLPRKKTTEGHSSVAVGAFRERHRPHPQSSETAGP